MKMKTIEDALSDLRVELYEIECLVLELEEYDFETPLSEIPEGLLIEIKCYTRVGT